MDARLAPAAREFNAGRFFEAHEELEERLDDLPDDLWQLFLGLIQIAVGYHKLASGHPGAARMLGLGLEKIAECPGDAAGVDLASLRERAAADRRALLDGTFDPEAFRTSPPRLLPRP